MKKSLVWLLLFAMLLGLCGCSGAEKLEFYVIPREMVSGKESDSQLLSLAKEEGRLAFTNEDLEGYLWEDHTVRLKERPLLGSPSDGGSRIFQADSGDRFLLVLGGKVLYSGGFLNSTISAELPINPYIRDVSAQSFVIGYAEKYGEQEDPRGNQELYDFLVAEQLLSSKLNKE